jgi:hypothetical protein
MPREVFIGPNDPIGTDPRIMLWYDTDATFFAYDALVATVIDLQAEVKRLLARMEELEKR